MKEIPSMKYKTNITENIRLKMNKIKKKYGKDINIKISSSKEEGYIHQMKLTHLLILKNPAALMKKLQFD